MWELSVHGRHDNGTKESSLLRHSIISTYFLEGGGDSRPALLCVNPCPASQSAVVTQLLHPIPKLSDLCVNVY